MEELTLRLPAETKESLEAEAAERGLSVGAHIRDVLDAYRSTEPRRPCPAYEVEYSHSVSTDAAESTEDSHKSDGTGEEIGSFRYGSKSIFS